MHTPGQDYIRISALFSPPFIPPQSLDRKVMQVSMATAESLTGQSIPHTNGEKDA